MTGLDVIMTNRVAYQRMCRRRMAYSRVLALLRYTALLLMLAWCYTARAELSRSFDKVLQTIVTRM